MVYVDLAEAIRTVTERLYRYGLPVSTGHWQGVEGDFPTRELLSVQFAAPVPETPESLAVETTPSLPWAEEHFQERVGRKPTNPGDTYHRWPYWRGAKVDDSFTHTYQERFWPHGYAGIRYPYGDLDDVVALLRRHPHTRQAYMPIFFPEDTGSVHSGRVPCTIGYGFLLRGEVFHCFYTIRSCDAVRHLRDDVYLTCRLLQWVRGELGWSCKAMFHFHAFSLHCFETDLRKGGCHDTD